MIGSIGRITPFERLHRIAVASSIAEVSQAEAEDGAAICGDGLRTSRTDREKGMPTYRDYLSRLSRMVPQKLHRKDKARSEEEGVPKEPDSTPIGWLIPDQYLPHQEQGPAQDSEDLFVAREESKPQPDPSFNLGTPGDEWLLTPFAA